jgi:hypothetical protein
VVGANPRRPCSGRVELNQLNVSCFASELSLFITHFIPFYLLSTSLFLN